MPANTLGRRPVPVVPAGALAIAFSGILYVYADVSDDRRVLALRGRCPCSGCSRWLEEPAVRAAAASRAPARLVRRRVLRGRPDPLHNAIEQVGAGLATVLGNTQVVLVALLAWAALGERPPRSALAAIPVVSVGVVLISGVFEEGAYGANPALGALFGVLTGIAYSGFLLALREGNRDMRRPAGPPSTRRSPPRSAVRPTAP